ncbi:MAG: 7-cyano-7-deazaguanine synthase [Bacteroidales bacterium]|nr:7-cyano-7-deazaguanine synthase [Bacteroidales bacterium]
MSEISTIPARKAVISLSGGLDSTMLLATLLAEGKEVRCYAFQYGQKHAVELQKAEANVAFMRSKGLPVSLQTINLEDVFSDSASSLCKGGDAIPEGSYDDEGMKSTVVENRNIIFSSIVYGKALGWANKTGENVIITLGLHQGDHTIYPDCTVESQTMARELFRISNWGSERVDYTAPFNDTDKAGVLSRGLEALRSLGFTAQDIDFVLSHTHTCYNPDEQGRSCGVCGSCNERKEAFEKNHISDPIIYQICRK